ncbi:hypothetical protein AMK16_32900 [Streptomyces sp. CB00455]|nr:hypothetical protein AMK16_32900 [Streptomyces sp. CB00455]
MTRAKTAAKEARAAEAKAAESASQKAGKETAGDSAGTEAKSTREASDAEAGAADSVESHSNGGADTETTVSCELNSFPTGTRVQMADGTTKEIQDIRVGDTVLATDPQTGETRPQRVTDTITTPDDKNFTDLTLTDESNPRAPPVQLTSTLHHPHWNDTRHQWVDAGDFNPGDHLRRPDGTTLTVKTKRNYPYAVTTHNLTVNNFHTYYVLAGATPVLVHNCNLGDYADSLRAGFNKTDGPFFAAKYTSPSGRTYFGHSGHGLTPAPGGEVDSLVRQFTPEGGRYHAGCAETMCLIQAEAAEGAAGIRGGSFEVVKVRGLNSPPGGAHGTPASPCALVCQPRLQH